MDNSPSSRAPGSPGPDFSTPRTKLSRMLAEIDNAPTPSPTKKTSSGAAEDVAKPSVSEEDDAPRAESVSSPDLQPTNNGKADSESDEDSDDAVRRPQGRAAKRMLDAGRKPADRSSPLRSSPPKRLVRRPSPTGSVEELYSSTPFRRAQTQVSNNGSPALSNSGNGLFVSPAKSTRDQEESEDELPSNPFGSKEKLAELVAQKRAERLAREAEEKQRKKRQRQQASSSAHASSDLPDETIDGPGDEPNSQINRILSDASRPARKASKKALLDMERETQRLARQQALAHQMKVKKKFTTSDLFARFNMKKPEAESEAPNQPRQQDDDTSASSAPNSDGSVQRAKHPVSTPPSSPPTPFSAPTPFDKQKALVEQGALSKLVPVREDSITSLAQMSDDDEELGDIADILKADKQKKEAASSAAEMMPPPSKKGLKVTRFGKQAARPQALDSDEDDDLEIIPRLPPHLKAFDRAIGATGSRSADSKALHNLRHLAHLNHNDAAPRRKKGVPPSISHTALEARLRRQAKEQARKQQLERIEELRAKGIDVQTIEEREQEAESFEDMLENARLQAQELRRMEKRKFNGEEGVMEASEDEDEDFEPEGSEEEDVAEGNALIDEAADESEGEVEAEGSEIEAEVEPGEDEIDEELLPHADDDQGGGVAAARPRKPRKSRVVQDDEDEEIDEPQDGKLDPTPKATPAADPFAAFNFGAGGFGGLMSPTQAFNATMHTPSQTSQSQGDTMDILRRIAPHSSFSLPPTLPEIESQTQMESQAPVFAGSQVPESQRIDLNWETQAPETPVLNRNSSALAETPTWEPTQDPGLPSPWPNAPRQTQEDALDSPAEHETQSTVNMRVTESPMPTQTAPKNRGKLTRRQAPVVDSSDDEAPTPAASKKSEKQDAFREMSCRRKEAMTALERTEADKELKAMMEEQAEESEDEYAGLGGDDFVAPETEADKEMIDSSAIDVDERALAAHYAERERERNEAETSRLYKDLTTGVLRRKMGANAFDLEEDEDELAVRRRRMRQQEEAKKRRALLRDDNVKSLAEGGRQSKGKDAFLKAIADDELDEDMVGMEEDEDQDASAAQATQEESQQSQAGASTTVLQETSGNKRRRPEGEDESQGRLPAKQRRTAPSTTFRRPQSMLEVQESVSFLLDEPQTAGLAGPTVLDISSESEHSDSDNESVGDEDEEAAEQARSNEGGFAPNPLATEAQARKDSIDMPPPPRLPAAQRRTAAPVAAKAAVIDRLSLKRASSTTDPGSRPSAWGNTSTSNSGFKAPSLLRRATTSASNANDRGVSTGAGKFTGVKEGSGLKQGGSKKSSLAYQARVEERKANVEAGARRREENTRRIAKLRREGSSASAAAGGGWGGRFD